MKKLVLLLCIAFVFLPAAAAIAWEAQGRVAGTEVEYSELVLSKAGVSVRLTNTTHTNVKVSMKLTFYNREGNVIGYSIFGLREMQAESSVNISGNYLNGNWKLCRDAPRMVWEKMTYEYVYE